MSFDLHRSARRSVASTGLALALVALGGAAWWSVDSAAQIAATPPPVVAPAVPVAGRPVPMSYADAVARVAPAVVTIRVEKKASFEPTSGQPDDFFRRFFGDRMPSPERQPRQRGLGSGVIISQDGRILTNAHVVDGADSVRVVLTDGREYTAKVIGVDKPTDLAVIDVEASGLPTLLLGNSDLPRVGDIVLAVGNPLGVGQTVTMGILSAKGRTTGTGDSYEDFLQTDAPINQGNSGGALVTATGELIGINSQILSPSGGNIGIGFAIPANMARHVVDEITTTGSVRRAKLGVTVQPITAELARSLRLNDVKGALVSGVENGSPAEGAGIVAGDVIVKFNGHAVENSNDLHNHVGATRPGSPATVTVVRNGRSQELKVTLAELETKRAARDQSVAESGALGMTVEPLTPEIARQLELPRGAEGVVVDQVDPDGAAAEAGLKEGDLIRQVNGKAVHSAAEFRQALRTDAARPALVLVQRGEGSFFATLDPRA